MPTLKDLIDSTGRLADSVLEQASAINRLVPAFEQLRRDVHTLLSNHDLDRASLDYRLREIDKNIALLLDNVKDVQRDVTNPHLRLPPVEIAPQPHDKGVVAIFNGFEKLRTSTKIVIVVVVLAVAASGFIWKFLG